MLKVFAATALTALVLPFGTVAQTCSGGSVAGVVRDTTAALIPGATISLDGKSERAADSRGRFSFPCLSAGSHALTASFQDFAPSTLKIVAPHAAELAFKLVPSANASVTVEGDSQDVAGQAPGGGNGIIVAGKQLQSLADDPDDLLRELQQLSAASGGSPGKATISVDGFQDDAKLPPKDSIAYINVSPDLFSAEYREPPFGGGRVEVYTKPGAKNLHGALFLTNSSSFMNASDAFTTSTGSLGKQRYGFDLSGPVRKQGSNFSLNLEHRSIDETVAVNATTLDSNGNLVNTRDTVPIPQRLWIGNARVDWQLGPKNIAFVSYSANVSHFQNLGVGGQSLRTVGYDSGQTDYTVRASNVTTVSPRLVHEARASYERYNETILPNSSGPTLQVAGYFNGGGAAVGNTRNRRWRIEFNDDFILNTKTHLIKAGVQLFYTHRDSDVLNFFNGTYIFSGYATGNPASPFVSAVQQFQQAQTSGGTATEFNNVGGNPNVVVSQVRLAGFYQDNVKLNTKWSVFYGLRYFLETDPANFNAIAPRVGLSYTPDKKQTWVLKSHFGLFNDQYGADAAEELHREDGVQRITSLIYKPVYGNPFAGATPIHSLRTTVPNLHVGTYAIGDFSVSKDLPLGFNLNAQSVFIRFLSYARTLNINQPLTPDPHGPRPIAPNVNILQVQTSGGGEGHGEFVGLSNFKRKRVQFFIAGLHINIRDNTNDDEFFQPQSAYTDAGETVRRANQGLWQVFGNTSISLPLKLALSGNGYAEGGHPFNILTGADNNGDGNFNDRPQFAPAGSAANGTTVFRTPFGLLTNAGAIVNGIPAAPIARDLGALPWTFHIDANLQRAFKLTANPKAEHPQTITANIRSTNFLNHTNVTGEGNVLGSPQFLVPVTADKARRVEIGLRYSF